uniref:Uncharacterized protein n=1 Tax=Romanomermis culicivorax TaxID=13658 RepID=A0A915JKD4_ROMCU
MASKFSLIFLIFCLSCICAAFCTEKNVAKISKNDQVCDEDNCQLVKEKAKTSKAISAKASSKEKAKAKHATAEKAKAKAKSVEKSAEKAKESKEKAKAKVGIEAKEKTAAKAKESEEKAKAKAGIKAVEKSVEAKSKVAKESKEKAKAKSAIKAVEKSEAKSKAIKESKEKAKADAAIKAVEKSECSSFFNTYNILMRDFGISPNENSTEIELPTKKPKPENQSSSSIFLCRQFDDDQKLYDRLSKSSHFNPKLMANTIDEVVWKMNDDFQDQLLFFETNDQDEISNDDPVIDNESLIENTCDHKCRKSRNLFARILKLQLNVETQELNSSILEQPFSDSDSTKNFSCSKPDRVIKIGHCRSKVKIDNSKFISLCPICRFLYKLPDYCFPRYISALHCYNKKSISFDFSNQQNLTCIHESWSGRAHGKCVQKATNLVIMRNRGDRSCPDWIFESLTTPINCECFLNTRSWLKS